jgi:hypothetical protein
MGGVVKAISKVVGSVTGANAAARSQKKAAREQARIAREQEVLRQRQSQVEGQRERIRSQREARIRRADIISSSGSAGLGLSGTSGVVGGVSSITSQDATNQSAINTTQKFASDMGTLNNQMSTSIMNSAIAQADYQQQASGINTIFSLASFGALLSKGGGIADVFSSSNTPGYSGGSSYVPKLDFTS